MDQAAFRHEVRPSLPPGKKQATRQSRNPISRISVTKVIMQDQRMTPKQMQRTSEIKQPIAQNFFSPLNNIFLKNSAGPHRTAKDAIIVMLPRLKRLETELGLKNIHGSMKTASIMNPTPIANIIAKRGQFLLWSILPLIDSEKEFKPEVSGVLFVTFSKPACLANNFVTALGAYYYGRPASGSFKLG